MPHVWSGLPTLAGGNIKYFLTRVSSRNLLCSSWCFFIWPLLVSSHTCTIKSSTKHWEKHLRKSPVFPLILAFSFFHLFYFIALSAVPSFLVLCLKNFRPLDSPELWSPSLQLGTTVRLYLGVYLYPVIWILPPGSKLAK